MRVRVHYGPDAGRIVEFPFHVGREIVAAGRGERVEDEGLPAETVLVAAPPVQHRDPALPAGTMGPSSRHGRRARR